MEFRPCIDIHNGKVKQIVGSSLKDEGNMAVDNFVSQQDAGFYADMYSKSGITGGHIIMLNAVDSEFYEATKEQALIALDRARGQLQIGGGINADNAAFFIEKGAGSVIVTSYVFKDGVINYDNLNKLVKAVGKEHIVLDLSCRRKHDAGQYYVVTDRWQKYTDVSITHELLDKLSEYCCEFLIHAVDVEGKANGIETDLVKLLGQWGKIPITYAGGVSSFDDLKKIKELGKSRLNVTIGSALDIFGGNMEYDKVVEFCK